MSIGSCDAVRAVGNGERLKIALSLPNEKPLQTMQGYSDCELQNPSRSLDLERESSSV